mgnify:CR=1 FL=1
MFQTLRVKLFASYLLVIVVCLILVGALGIFWLRQYEQETAVARGHVDTQLLARALIQLPTEASTPDTLLAHLRSKLPTFGDSLLAVDASGVILAGTLQIVTPGEQIPLSMPAALNSSATGVPWWRWRSATGERFYLFYVPLERESLTTQVAYIALATPAVDVLRSWREWLLPLLAIGGLALAVSVLVSYLISCSVVRPLEAMTDAVTEMAAGHYYHNLPVSSRDEIGRLADAFNRMSREVVRAQRMQRDLLVNMSHDLQTPLTSIRGFSQAIVEGKIRDIEGLQMAEQIIYEEASRMVRLVRDLLDLARLEAGQVQMARVPVDMTRLLQAAADKFRPRAAAAEIMLQALVPETLPPIVGDAERLELALGNLLDNALKYTARGGHVDLSGTVIPGNKLAGALAMGAGVPATTPNGRWLVVSVADTGIGIPPEDLAHIFERFYRGDKARTDREGIGLGLSIAREIVQAHGGEIVVNSQPGKGSCFSILLPLPESAH